MAVGSLATYANNAYHHWRGVLDTTLSDTDCQLLATGRWFSPGTPVSSTNKTNRFDITEILFIMALNTITLNTLNFESRTNFVGISKAKTSLVYVGWNIFLIERMKYVLNITGVCPIKNNSALSVIYIKVTTKLYTSVFCGILFFNLSKGPGGPMR